MCSESDVVFVRSNFSFILKTVLREMKTLTRPVSGEQQISPGIWKFCRESGGSKKFQGNMKYFRDIICMKKAGQDTT